MPNWSILQFVCIAADFASDEHAVQQINFSINLFATNFADDIMRCCGVENVSSRAGSVSSDNAACAAQAGAALDMNS